MLRSKLTTNLLNLFVYYSLLCASE